MHDEWKDDISRTVYKGDTSSDISSALDFVGNLR